MSHPPTGTVTFLFTDIEGSTRRWEHARDDMARDLAWHDALLRSAIEDRGGYVFKTVGDAFCAAFAEPAAAVSAALAAQRALANEPWESFVNASDSSRPSPDPVEPLRVRMALHSGIAEARDGDYFGPAVNRVARLLATGHGGQVLLSLAAEELVRDALSNGSALRDLGEHRLRDLARPERVFQLLAPDLPADFPPLASLDAHRHNLPEQLTSFVGRSRELTEVKRHVAAARLVTLLGVGGTGKTRLALQVAADLSAEFPSGVWFIDLAPVNDPALVANAAAAAMGIRSVPGQPIEDILVDMLKDRRPLLVLDNCEHLVEACARVADRLLQRTHQVHLLATSREPLCVPGEVQWPVPPLGRPEQDATGPTAASHGDPGNRGIHAVHPDGGNRGNNGRADDLVSHLRQFEAVQLFVDRAAAVRPDFAITTDNARAVAEICARLDGLPLALELACARLRVLTPEQIASRLDDRLRLLTAGARTVLPRQQTLRAAVDWSFDLLEPLEQTLFARLAVFRGGWTLEAAEAVCADETLPAEDITELLWHLVDKSLVVTQVERNATRYKFLESIQQYAAEKLHLCDDEVATRRRLLEYFVGLVREGSPQFVSASGAAWLDRLNAERANLWAALDTACGHAELAGSGLEMAGKLWRMWHQRGRLDEGRMFTATALRVTAADAPAVVAERASALNAAGILARRLGDPSAAEAHYRASLAIREALGDRIAVGRLLHNLGGIPLDRGDLASARQCYEDSLAIKRGIDTDWSIASTLNSLGIVLQQSGDPSSARVLYEESLAIMRTMDDLSGIGLALANLGTIAEEQGDWARARELLGESLTHLRAMGGPSRIGWVLGQLGDLARQEGEFAKAHALLDEGLALRREAGDLPGVEVILSRLGDLALDEGDVPAAAAYLTECFSMLSTTAEREVLTTLERVARLATVTNHLATAVRLLGFAASEREARGMRLPPMRQVACDDTLRRARAALGEGAFDAVWAAGRALGRDEALGLAREVIGSSAKG